jgi:hypothetical protein
MITVGDGLREFATGAGITQYQLSAVRGHDAVTASTEQQHRTSGPTAA